jgi:hypothetical protein
MNDYEQVFHDSPQFPQVNLSLMIILSQIIYNLCGGKKGTNKLQMNPHLFSLGSATVSLTWPTQTL